MTGSSKRVKDIFLFSCYTGLSYIDVKELVPVQLLNGIDNNYWLHTKREKTNEAVKIYLLPKGKRIVEKYTTGKQSYRKTTPRTQQSKDQSVPKGNCKDLWYS